MLVNLACKGKELIEQRRKQYGEFSRPDAPRRVNSSERSDYRDQPPKDGHDDQPDQGKEIGPDMNGEEKPSTDTAIEHASGKEEGEMEQLRQQEEGKFEMEEERKGREEEGEEEEDRGDAAIEEKP